jgi:uncharacterized protein with GYD domain
MVTYVVLMKLTDQGVKDIKNAPKRIEANAKAIEAVGGKMTGFFLTVGRYDYVAIVEMPSDEVGMTFLLGLGAAGNVKTESMKAYPREQFAEFVKKLP